MALDSLDLLEFRTLLGRIFTRPFPPTFFFSHPTLADIRRYLEADVDAPADERAVSRARLEPPRAAREDEHRKPHAPHAIAIVGMAMRFPGAPETLKLLLERGGNPDAASSKNVKPIDEAHRNRQEETERILAEALGKR